MIGLDESLITESFVRASGPGGQNVNKVSTAVELRFDVARAALSDDVKARLRVLAGARMTVDDVLVIEAREHRTQGKNRDAAREKLVDLLTRAARPPKARRPTRPSRSSKEARLTAKRRQSAIKKARGSRDDD